MNRDRENGGAKPSWIVECVRKLRPVHIFMVLVLACLIVLVMGLMTLTKGGKFSLGDMLSLESTASQARIDALTDKIRELEKRPTCSDAMERCPGLRESHMPVARLNIYFGEELDQGRIKERIIDLLEKEEELDQIMSFKFAVFQLREALPGHGGNIATQRGRPPHKQEYKYIQMVLQGIGQGDGGEVTNERETTHDLLTAFQRQWNTGHPNDPLMPLGYFGAKTLAVITRCYYQGICP